MAQLFTPAATTLFRVVIVLIGLGAVAAGAIAYVWARSGSTWNLGKPAAQPVPFRHDLQFYEPWKPPRDRRYHYATYDDALADARYTESHGDDEWEWE